MFLWVNDFYSLGKIISAFPQIVLLYLKIAWRKGQEWGGVEEEGGLYCLGSGSRVPYWLLTADDGWQRVSRVDLHFRMYSSSQLNQFTD